MHTEDGGITWQASSEGLTRTFPLQLALDQVKAATVYAATAGSGVFRSADRGRTWKPYGPELSRAIVRCLVADGSTADRLFAGTDRGVFASVPAVKTWAPLLEGLPRAPVYALLADPESPATLFAGTGEGLFFTRDSGQSWGPVPAGDVAAPVTALAFDRSSRRLYAGTLGAGVFAVAAPRVAPTVRQQPPPAARRGLRTPRCRATLASVARGFGYDALLARSRCPSR